MNNQNLRREIEAVNDSDDALQIAADIAAKAALNSSQAAAIRFNNVLATINTTIRTGAASFANDFVSDLEKGDTILQSLQDAAATLGKTLQTAGLNSLVNSGLNSLTGSTSQTAGATSSATILQASATAMVATWTSGATATAAILSGGGATAGAALGVGGTAAGVGVDVGTSLGGAELVTSGAAAGGFIARSLVRPPFSPSQSIT